jgi:hypothetical protein
MCGGQVVVNSGLSFGFSSIPLARYFLPNRQEKTIAAMDEIFE